MYKHLLALIVLAPAIAFSQTDAIFINDAGILPDTPHLIIPNTSIVAKPLSYKYEFRVREHVAPAVLMFLAGAADGLNQAISYRYSSFKKAFPGVNDVFWSPKISYRNKYKNHDPTQGAKFFGSTSFLVWTTDGYHATRFAEHLFMVGAVTVKLTQQRKKWYYYVAEAAGYWVINRAGFAVVYNSF